MKKRKLKRFKKGERVIVRWRDIVSGIGRRRCIVAEDEGHIDEIRGKTLIICNSRYLDKGFKRKKHRGTTAIPCGCIKSIRRVKG